MILYCCIIIVGFVVVIFSKEWVAKTVGAVFIFIFTGQLGYEIKPEKELIPVDISVYHAVAEQTDSAPLITADGSVIDPQNLQPWAAISRDQLADYPFGSKIVIRCKCPYDSTTWEVHDVMNARYTTAIDLLVPESETGKWEGVIYETSH